MYYGNLRLIASSQLCVKRGPPQDHKFCNRRYITIYVMTSQLHGHLLIGTQIKGNIWLIGTVCQTPINFLLMLVYVNVSSDKGDHLLIGIKFMLPDHPVYQVCTALAKIKVFILMITYGYSLREIHSRLWCSQSGCTSLFWSTRPGGSRGSRNRYTVNLGLCQYRTSRREQGMEHGVTRGNACLGNKQKQQQQNNNIHP